MATLNNQYGEIVVQLVQDGNGYFELPKDFNLDYLAIGDTYTVVAETEDEEEL